MIRPLRVGEVLPAALYGPFEKSSLNPAFVLVAEEAEQVVGVVFLACGALPAVWIPWIATAPPSLSVFRALLASAAAWGRERDCRVLAGLVPDERLLRVYTKWGARLDPRSYRLVTRVFT